MFGTLAIKNIRTLHVLAAENLVHNLQMVALVVLRYIAFAHRDASGRSGEKLVAVDSMETRNRLKKS